MKASQRTQRRHSRQTGPSISLFPFLAVLICTMGALVPLLLAISRTARQQAEAAAMAKIAEESSELTTQREDVQWRIEQLKQSREKTESQVAEARLELGHLEDHARRLRDQLARYERVVRDLEKQETAGHQAIEQSRVELERSRAQIETARQEIVSTRQAASSRNRSFAIVPYEGPNQTRRRPIYLECRADAVVLQPEGVSFTISDFDGPMGPGNPLASSLRAAREYLLSKRDFDPEAGEPYPMLLVRPDGIGAYYAARAAMKSWGFEFGYELVGDDWKLAYPQPDQQLVGIVRQVVTSARVRQAQIIASAPREYERRRQAAYHGSSSGGSTHGDGENDGRSHGVSGGSGFEDSGTPATGGYVSGYRSSGSGRGNANSNHNPYVAATAAPSVGAAQGSGVGTAGYGNGGSGYGNGVGVGNVGGGVGASGVAGAMPGGVGSNAAGTGVGGVGGVGTGAAGALGGGDGTGVGPAGTGATNSGMSNSSSLGDDGPALTGNGSGDASGDAGRQGTVAGNTASDMQFGNAGRCASNNASGGTHSSLWSPNNAATGTVGSAAPQRAGSAAGDGSGGSVLRPEGYVAGQPAREQPNKSHTASAENLPEDGPRASYAMRPGEWQPSPEQPPQQPKPKPEDEDDKRRKPKKPARSRHDEDWGLRDASNGAVGVTRPIRVECHADRLVIASDRGGQPTVVPLGERTDGAVDDFIDGVWQCMDRWGIAGRGMYWRPILRFQVAPDAEQRFQELSAALENSGLTVERL